MPQKFSFAGEFVNPNLEWALLAAIVADPLMYWETLDSLPPGVLTVAKATYETIAAAVEAEKPVPPIDNLKEVAPAPDPTAAAKELAELYQKRLYAQVIQRSAEKLPGETKVVDLIANTSAELTLIETAVREMRSGQAMSVADLLPEVLKEMTSRQKAVKETTTVAVGLPTGIMRLDRMIGGLQTGLHILAAEPGEGKTSLALQIAAKVAGQAPALFVSFEESLNRLSLKSVCQQSNLEMKRFFDGYGDLAQLNTAITTYGSRLRAFYLIEGNSRLTTPQLKAKALQIAARHKTNQCLVIIDYLQKWASSRREFTDFRHIVGALVSELRDIANRLNSPILVISSQNRGGQGSSFMTSLKESGDLEYAADSILFLVKSKRPANPPARAVDLEVSKNRFGDTGTVPLIFRPDIGIFREEVQF